MHTEIVFHLRATNDVNGNPRRCFLVLDLSTGATLDCIDEGYSGRAAWQKRYPRAVEADSIEVTPREYRAKLKAHGRK